MDFVRTILVATDHMAHARHAEARAALLGAELKADAVEVMRIGNAKVEREQTPAGHVRAAAIDWRDTNAAVPALLRCHTAPAQPHAPAAATGPAAIVERANAIGADLTVIAARREGLLGGILTRFRNDELIRLGERPVLLVNRKPMAAYARVLVAVDFSAESQQAARMALTIAPSALFTFLHVFRVIDEEVMIEHGVAAHTIQAYRVRAREAARERLNRFIDALGPRKQWIYRAIEHGLPGQVIPGYAKEIHADLIAVGKHGKSRFIDLFLGSVTQRLVDTSDCDVLVTTSSSGKDPDMPPAA